MASIDLLRIIREPDKRLVSLVGDLNEVTVWYGDDSEVLWTTQEVEFEADTIGEYIGSGVGVMVVRLEDE